MKEHTSPLPNEKLVIEPMNGAISYKSTPELDFNDNYEWYQDYDN